MTKRLLKADWMKNAARILRKYGFTKAGADEYAAALWHTNNTPRGDFYEKGVQVSPADAVNSDREHWEE